MQSFLSTLLGQKWDITYIQAFNSVPMLNAICYFLLSGISVLGDTLFIYYVSTTFLMLENGGLLSSIILGIDAFFEICLGPFIAKHIDKIVNVRQRVLLSMSIQTCLVVMTFLPALTLTASYRGAPILFVASIAVMRFFTLLDVQLRAVIPLVLESIEVIPLVKSLSFSNFSQRAIVSIGTFLVPFFLEFSWGFVCFVNSITFCFSIIGLTLLLKVLKKNNARNLVTKTLSKVLSVCQQDTKRKWIMWNRLTYLCAGVACGSGAFILTKSMLNSITSNEPVYLQALHGPSTIFIGYLLSLGIIISQPSLSHYLAQSAKRIIVLLLLLGISMMIVSYTSSYIQILTLLCAGVINGFSIVISDIFAQRLIAGEQFVHAHAKNQAFSKTGALISLLIAGRCIDKGYTVEQLLLCVGLAAVVVAVVFFLYAHSIEKENNAQGLSSRPIQ